VTFKKPDVSRTRATCAARVRFFGWEVYTRVHHASALRAGPAAQGFWSCGLRCCRSVRIKLLNRGHRAEEEARTSDLSQLITLRRRADVMV